WPEKFSISKESQEGTLGKKQEATLSNEGNQYIAAFRYELPAPGALIASAKPVNPQAQISLAVYSEGSGSEPIAKGEPGKKVEAKELQPGTYYVTVMEPWKDVIRTRVEVRTVDKPDDRAATGWRPASSKAIPARTAVRRARWKARKSSSYLRIPRRPTSITGRASSSISTRRASRSAAS